MKDHPEIWSSPLSNLKVLNQTFVVGDPELLNGSLHTPLTMASADTQADCIVSPPHLSGR